MEPPSAPAVVVLDSTALAGPHWLERLLACAEADSRIGVVSPLSNAIVPGRGSAADPLPPWLTAGAMAMLVAGLSTHERPQVAFLDPGCALITREAIERAGPIDREADEPGRELERFGERVREAGLATVLADDVYVVHRGSAARRGPAQESVRGLPSLRVASALLTGNEEAAVAAFRASQLEPQPILFLRPDGAGESDEAARAALREAAGLRRLGVPVRLAAPADGLDELAGLAAGAGAVISTDEATHPLLDRLRERGGGFVAARYPEDRTPPYAGPEPSPTDAALALRAALSRYSRIAGQTSERQQTKRGLSSSATESRK